MSDSGEHCLSEAGSETTSRQLFAALAASVSAHQIQAGPVLDEQAPQALGQEGAAEELRRLPVLGAPFAQV